MLLKEGRGGEEEMGPDLLPTYELRRADMGQAGLSLFVWSLGETGLQGMWGHHTLGRVWLRPLSAAAGCSEVIGSCWDEGYSKARYVKPAAKSEVRAAFLKPERSGLKADAEDALRPELRRTQASHAGNPRLWRLTTTWHSGAEAEPECREHPAFAARDLERHIQAPPQQASCEWKGNSRTNMKWTTESPRRSHLNQLNSCAYHAWID